MAVVRVRAAIRLDGRRVHELRSLAAMAQANGGCDAVLPSSGMVPPFVRGLTVEGRSNRSNQAVYSTAISEGEPECGCKPRPSKQRRWAPHSRARASTPTAAGCPISLFVGSQVPDMA
jgi:hypothetical protein